MAKIAYGTTLHVEDAAGSGVFVKIAEIKSVAKPNAQVDDVEVTHMESPGRAKEYIAGLTDYGETSFDLNWNPGDATDQFIEAWRASGETRATKITYPGAVVDQFPSYVKGYEGGASAPGEALTGSLTIKIAGNVERL